jgi:tetrapyrrole methylase family protein / MazG family protein
VAVLGSASGDDLGMSPAASPRIVVVGLGPGGADLLVPAARAALRAATRRFVRTARHPAVEELAAFGVACEACDDVYEQAGAYDDVYATIAERVLAASDGLPAGATVAYAVPGHPLVAERSVSLLLARARERGIAVQVIPGLSYADLAWAAVGVDPADGTMVDGQDLLAEPPLRAADEVAVPAGARAELSGPTIVFHVTDARVLADLAVVLGERLPPDAPVTLLHHLGLSDEDVRTLPLGELARGLVAAGVEPDHLTSLFVDAPPGTGAAFAALAGLVHQLRAPGGCPWDAEQTHHSLTRHLVEEAYEVVEAIEGLPADAPGGEHPPSPDEYAGLRDELGDLLYQVVLHTALAEEVGGFVLADVADGIRAKLVRRHPHVFGAGATEAVVEGGTVDLEDAADADAVTRNWERIKRDERGGGSLLGSVPGALPSLLLVQKLLRKAASGQVDLADGAAARVADAARAVAAAPAPDAVALGELLATAVAVAREWDVDPEHALRAWSTSFRARFTRMEALAAARGVELGSPDAATVAALWREAGAPAGP